MPANTVDVSLPRPGRLELHYLPEVNSLTGEPSPLLVKISQGHDTATDPRSPPLRTVIAGEDQLAQPVRLSATPGHRSSPLVPKDEASPPREAASDGTSRTSDTQIAGTQPTFFSCSSQSYTEPDSDALDPLTFVSSPLAPSSPSHVAIGGASQAQEESVDVLNASSRSSVGRPLWFRTPSPIRTPSIMTASAAVAPPVTLVKRRRKGDLAGTDPARSRAIRAPTFTQRQSIPR
ncbi:hypothetical protein FA95DRAFT_1613609 [Auriscalpium vulgare]|uniref:Uncharacterized protein n=1 Tax=Auriscalpium vulgare TaxID=40419 RepID=A0ACB8R2J2_9AGAM|nr:hypothetical protein FA95DRAFT_1613609 [Auriscalpium vulgare]